MARSTDEVVATVGCYESALKDAQARNVALLVQFGSEACPRCPAFALAISELVDSFTFAWKYCDAHESELPEHFSISKLPAFVIATGSDDPIVVANATKEQLRDAVRRHCHPVLHLDADF